MNGWCLLLVCLGAALVQGEELSEFREEKAEQFFEIADRNGDGTLQKSDYVLTADYVLALPNYDKYNASYLRIVVVDRGWNIFPKQEMTWPQMKATLESLDDATMKGVLNAFMENIYGVWDYIEPPNCLNEEELESELRNAGKVTHVDEQASLAFDAIDEDEDGCATLAEYQDCSTRYFLSEDRQDECTDFFGKLNEF